MKLPKDMTGMLVLAGMVGVGGFILYRAFGKKGEEQSNIRGGCTSRSCPAGTRCIGGGKNSIRCVPTDEVSGVAGNNSWNPQPVPSKSTNWGADVSKSSMPYGIPQNVKSFDTSDMSLVPNDLEFSGARGGEVVEHYVKPLWTVG